MTKNLKIIQINDYIEDVPFVFVDFSYLLLK